MAAVVVVAAGCNDEGAGTCAARSGPVPAPVDDPAGRVIAEPTDEVAFVYDPAVLRTFELEIAAEDLAFLDAAPAREEYVPATFVFEGTEYGPVGVRYKGGLGAFVGCTTGSTKDDPFDTSGAKTCPKLGLSGPEGQAGRRVSRRRRPSGSRARRSRRSGGCCPSG